MVLSCPAHGDAWPDVGEACLAAAMTRSRTYQAQALLCLGLIVFIQWLAAAVVEVVPGADSLQKAIAGAAAGDTLQLQDGIYHGPVVIDRRITLLGNGKSIIDGKASGRVLTIAAADTVVRNVSIRNSGIDLSEEDSGIFITKEADRTLVEDNTLNNNLIGIYLKGPDDAIVRNNDITGNKELRVNERGNGIHLWNTPGSIIEGNNVRYGRDGIFVTTSNNNIFRNNHLQDLRFAIHYMYTNNSEVSGNISKGNHVAFALMYSSYLNVKDNHSIDDRDRGLFFNYANYSTVSNNSVKGGPEKCVFIYNSNFNQINGNVFRQCQIGVHFTAGSEDNQISGNAFIANKTQVKYVGTRFLEWSVDGRGNYWADHTAFDLDGDNIADKPYQPNNLVDQIIWRHPLAKILMNSPAFHLLQWAQSQFPALYPGGVIDSAPIMHLPEFTKHVNG
jgi:nitrous oxidase accessory protein